MKVGDRVVVDKSKLNFKDVEEVIEWIDNNPYENFIIISIGLNEEFPYELAYPSVANFNGTMFFKEDELIDG